MLQPEKERPLHVKAISRIARGISNAPESPEGVQLRMFLWSLYDGHHFLNLRGLTSELSAEVSAAVAEALQAAMAGELTAEHIGHGLKQAGELARWQNVIPGMEVIQLMDEASLKLIAVLTLTPPCDEHVEVTRILKRLETVKDQLIRKS